MRASDFMRGRSDTGAGQPVALIMAAASAGYILFFFSLCPCALCVHPKTLLRERGFSLGVLIASCTANSNLEYKTPTRCVRHCPSPSL